MSENLEKAKKMYPKGTRFIPPHIEGQLKKYSVEKCISTGQFEEKPWGSIWIKNISYNYTREAAPIIFSNTNGWAKIIKEETMCTEKTIKLSLEKAKDLYGKNPEMDILLLDNFTKEELETPTLPKKWEDLKMVNGFYISSSSVVTRTGDMSSQVMKYNSNTFATEKQAKSALAMAQLSQLMKVYNDGWEFNPDGSKANVGYGVYRNGNNKIETASFLYQWEFICFKSPEIRDKFLKNFEDLIKQYFMID